MKTDNSKKLMREKWSIKQCEDEKGWKLKNVRRVKVKAESLDGVKIMRELHTTNFDSKFDDRYWRVSDIHLIENDKLRSQFEEYKKELIELGRSSETVKETLAFSAETEKACKDISQEGCKVGSKKRHVLGHTGSGVHLVRHYDILTRYLMFQQYTSPAYIFVYKTFLGKSKPIVPRLHKDDHYVSPYVGFDSHISARHVDREMPICEALNCSYMYLYEFDQISSNTVKHPRQILPYVIIQLEKKIPSIPENPFLSVGSDDSRSTWEVKGETRRGFRFMFTKSGLKGKHKVFSKSPMNFGSHLKGQILEMRTKSAGSVVDAKPPLLQKIDDNCTSRNTVESGKSKPPDLQKLTVRLKQTNSKIDNLIVCKDIDIPEHLRSIKQLTNLKPCVKLKRLTSKCFKRSRGRPKNKKSIDAEQENKTSDCDLSSKTLVFSPSGLTPLNVNDTELGSNQIDNTKSNEYIPAEINSADKSIQFDNMSTEKSTFNICDITKGRDKTLTLAENKSSKLYHSLKAKNQNRDDEKKQLKNNEPDNVLPNDIHSVVKCTSSEIKDKQLHENPKMNSTTVLTKRNEKHDYVSKNQTSEKQSHLRSENAIKTTDAMQQKSVDNKVYSEMKRDRSYNCLKAQLTTQDDTASKLFLKESSTKQYVQETGQCIGANGNLSCAKSNTIPENVDKGVNVTNHKENQDSDHKKTALNKKLVSSRCSPTKTKFGEIEYTLDKSKERQSYYFKGKSQTENNPRKQSPEIETKIQEYDFSGQDTHQRQKANRYKLIALNKPVTKEVSNQELKTLNDHCSENSDKDKKSLDEPNEFSQMQGNSFASLQSEQVQSGEKSNCITESDKANSCIIAELCVADLAKSNSAQAQSQRVGLEKSKSPVVANAAPDMLNISPILVSAQTSTHSAPDSSKTFSNNSIEDILTSEHKLNLYQDLRVTNKNELFCSEMTSFYNASCVDLIKSFPEQISQTIVVNPVIRTSLNAKKVISPANEKIQFNTKTVNSDHKNSKPKSDGSVVKSKSSRPLKHKGGTSNAVDVTQIRGTCQTNKEATGQSNIKPNNKISKVKMISNTSQTHQTTASVAMDLMQGEGTCKTSTTHLQKPGISISKDINDKKNDSSKQSDSSIDENVSRSEGSCSMSVNPSSTKKGNDCYTPKGVKGSKIKRAPSNIKTKNTDRSIKDKAKKVEKKLENKLDLTNKSEVNKNNPSSVGMVPLKKLLKEKANNSLGVDNNSCEQQQLKDKTINKKEKMPKSINKDVIKTTKLHVEKAVPTTKEVESCKTSCRQQMSTSSENAAQNSLENPNVTIDTHTADRFRSFLSSTAAVAMQHRKSVEQKNETDEDIDKEGFQHGTDDDSQPLKENTIQSNPINDEINKQVGKCVATPVSEDKECQHARGIVKTRQFTDSTQRKQPLPSISKEPYKVSRNHVLKSTRMDSLEIQDSDSQDTVIGGVPNSPILSPFTPMNDSFKNNENHLTNSTAQTLQLNETSVIKQENKDGQDQTEAVTEKDVENNSQHLKETQFETESVNHVSSTNEHGLISSENIKTEPVDEELIEKHCTSVKDIDMHPVKTEPFSPDTSTTFFPHIRKELAKGTALLDATQCRSAIVDTLKELSFVLKFLTDNNVQSPNKKEQAALVAKKMCDELTKERSNLITSGHSSGYEIDLKHEPVNAGSQQPHQNLNITPGGNFSSTVSDDLNYENVSSEKEFQYNYILKSEDEYQSTNENITECSETTPLVTFQPDSSKQPENEKSFSNNIKLTFEENPLNDQHGKDELPQMIRPNGDHEPFEEPLIDYHEKDELPQLFDPNGEPNITIIEQFGIPIGIDNFDSKPFKGVGHCPAENVSDNRLLNLSLQGDKLVKEIKMEREKNIDCATVKAKPKQNLNFKSGILNKGLKERKNMFDLKINATRSISVRNLKQSESKSLPSTKIIMNEILPEKPKRLTKDEERVLNKDGKEIFESDKNETNDIMNEVYKTVCEKLSSLKENDIQENDSLFHQGYTPEFFAKEKMCDSSMNPENPIPIKDMRTQKAVGNNESINDPSMLNPSHVNAETNLPNNKNDAIIPFQTEIRLKRQKNLKYKRGMLNKKSIDYSQCLPKMAKTEDNLKNTTMPNQEETDTSQISDIELRDETEFSQTSHKLSEIIEQGATLFKGGSKQERFQEISNRKRSSSDKDENANPKCVKYSSEKCQSIENESIRRSRSRSSHRSSSSRQKSSINASVCENSESPSYSDRNFQHLVQTARFNYRPYQSAKPFYAPRGRFHARGSYRNYNARYNMSTNRYGNFTGKASFNKSGTGYFSWRRKYQPKRNANDGYVVTGKGSVVSASEYAEWSRFKERETLRDQIENAIKEYRRTFEFTPDDMKGDEKVASYLTFLTDKLDKIQNKRNKLIPQRRIENRREKHRHERRSSSERKTSRSPQSERDCPLYRKLDKAQTIHMHETQEHSSVAGFSGSLASDSDNLSYKQRKHASGIEDLLKEHISKHYEHLTRQIKQEMDDLKTSKREPSRKEHNQGSYQNDRHYNKYDSRIKYNHDKYRSDSQDGYDTKRSDRDASSRPHRDYKHSGKDRYSSQHYDKHNEKYSYKDKYPRRHHSFKDYNSEYDPRKRNDFQYKSSYRGYSSDKYHGNQSTYQRNYNHRDHSRNMDFRKTYDYQQNYDKYQNRFHEDYKYFDKKKNDYDNKAFDLRDKMQHSKSYQPKPWIKEEYKKHYNKGPVETSEKTKAPKEDVNVDAPVELKVKDEFDATKYREFTPAFRGFNYRGRGFFRGINRFNPGYKPTYYAGKFSKFGNPKKYYHKEDKGTNNTKQDASKSQKCDISVEIEKDTCDKTD